MEKRRREGKERKKREKERVIRFGAAAAAAAAAASVVVIIIISHNLMDRIQLKKKAIFNFGDGREGESYRGKGEIDRKKERKKKKKRTPRSRYRFERIPNQSWLVILLYGRVYTLRHTLTHMQLAS